MRELYDADVWRIKKTLQKVGVAVAVAVSMVLLLMAVTDFQLPSASASASVGAPFAIISRYKRTKIPATLDFEKIPGGLKVCDANGRSLAYVYSRENPNDANMAKVLTEDEARRIASNIAKLPGLLSKGD